MKKKRKTPRKSSYKFTVKKHSKQGILSTIIGCLCLVSIISLMVISGNTAGNGDLVLGLIGDITFIFSIVGFCTAIAGFKDKDSYFTYLVIGAGLNSIIFISLLALFLIGVGF